MRMITVVATLSFFAASPLAGQEHVVEVARTQICSDGRPIYPSIGVGQYHCLGGSCRISDLSGTGYLHTFSSEPRLRHIDPDGPSAGKIEEGDVLVAVDGSLITSRDGGRKLASLPPGETRTLVVRHDGQESDVDVVPVGSCDVPSLIVSSPAIDLLGNVLSSQMLDASRMFDASRALQSSVLALSTPPTAIQSARGLAQTLRVGTADVKPPVEFGVELSCGDCGWSGRSLGWRGASTGGSPVLLSQNGRFPLHRGRVFVTSEFPVVRSVEKDGPADVAGMQIGDVILTVAGLPITARAAGERLGELEAGEPVDLEVRRGDRIVMVQVVPREASEKRQRM